MRLAGRTALLSAQGETHDRMTDVTPLADRRARHASLATEARQLAGWRSSWPSSSRSLVDRAAAARGLASGCRLRPAALVAASAVVNAWGRYTGGLLVAPAIALLFVMNIFPLLWSLGLSFFAYRANRAAPPTFVGLDNYEKRPHRPGGLGPPADHRDPRRPHRRRADGRSASCWRCCSPSSSRCAATCSSSCSRR